MPLPPFGPTERSYRPDARVYVSLTGIRWTVYELAARSESERPCLIFESDYTMRRVREYPANWRELSNIELDALSWNC